MIHVQCLRSIFQCLFRPLKLRMVVVVRFSSFPVTNNSNRSDGWRHFLCPLREFPMGISGYEYVLSCVIVSGAADLKNWNGEGVALDKYPPPPPPSPRRAPAALHANGRGNVIATPPPVPRPSYPRDPLILGMLFAVWCLHVSGCRGQVVL